MAITQAVYVITEVSGGRFDSAGGRLTDLVSKDLVIDVRLERIPLVHRATAVFCDLRATNYAVLQSHPNSWYFNAFLNCDFSYSLFTIAV